MVFSLLAVGLLIVFFSQRPLEARHRPWTGPHISADGWYYYHNLRSMVLDGDLDLKNDYRQFGNWYGFGISKKTGRPRNPFGVGPAIAWTPAFVIGHGLAKAINAKEPHRKAHGYSPVEQGFALTTSFIAGMAALFFCFAFCRRFLDPLPAFLGSVGAFLGGPLVWYTVFEPATPHALSALSVAAFIVIALPFRRRSLRQSLGLGLLAALAMLIRPQHVFLLLIPAVETIVFALRDKKEGKQTKALLGRLLFGASIAVMALVGFLPQLLAWKAVYGSAFVVPQGAGFMRWGASLWSEVLFSSRNGLFVYTPLIWFVPPGLIILFRRHRTLAALLFAAFFLEVFTNGAAWDWWGGGAYGGRRLTGCTIIFAIGLAAFFQSITGVRQKSSGRRARLMRVGAGVCFLALFIGYQGVFMRAYHQKRVRWDSTAPYIEKVAAAFGGAPRGLYRLIGNPFAFPANLLFALRHGVPLARYDAAVGPYLLDERVATTNPLRKSKRRAEVRLAGKRALPFLGRGLRADPDGAITTGDAAELFVPLNRTGKLQVHLELLGKLPSGAELKWNGEALKTRPSTRGTSKILSADVSAAQVERGINTLGVASKDTSLTLLRLVLYESDDWPARWIKDAP